MRLKSKTIFILAAILLTFSAQAADDLITLNFNAAVKQGYNEGVLNRNMSFFLKGQSHPKVITNHGEYKSNKKTNGVGKSQEKSCTWVLLSVLKTFQQRAKNLGANAVINIKSNYKSNEFIDDENYQCGDGLIMSGVALIGDVATLE